MRREENGSQVGTITIIATKCFLVFLVVNCKRANK
jgi:hypothetical protein